MEIENCIYTKQRLSLSFSLSRISASCLAAGAVWTARPWLFPRWIAFSFGLRTNYAPIHQIHQHARKLQLKQHKTKTKNKNKKTNKKRRRRKKTMKTDEVKYSPYRGADPVAAQGQ